LNVFFVGNDLDIVEISPDRQMNGEKDKSFVISDEVRVIVFF